MVSEDDIAPQGNVWCKVKVSTDGCIRLLSTHFSDWSSVTRNHKNGEPPKFVRYMGTGWGQ